MVGIADGERDIRVVVELKVVEDAVSGAVLLGLAQALLDRLEERQLESEGRVHQRQAALQQIVLGQLPRHLIPAVHVLEQHRPV